MGKNKDLIKKIRSIKEEVENHFLKLEKEFENNDIRYTFYHFKEVLRSMLKSLEELYERLGKKEEGEAVIKTLLGRLEKILEKNNCLEEYKQIYIKQFGKYP
jgi:ABC-type Fe3+-hydroxamate transport system substrate-binding protein